MSETVIESGLFALDPDKARVIRGLLLPFGERSRVSVSGAEPVEFGKGTVGLPRDPSVVTLNRDHDRFDPIGRAVEIDEQEDGIHVAFQIADTDEGDAYLQEYANGGRKALSAEIAALVRRGAQAIAGRLSGAAVVPEGAFAGAHLFAIGDITEELAEAEPEITDAATAVEEEQADEADNQEEDAMPEAVAPITLGTGSKAETELTKGDLFAAIEKNKQFGDPSDLAKFQAGGELFALGAATGQQGKVIAPQYIGQVWEGGDYVPRWMDLFAHDDLTALTVTGWRSVLRPTVATWAGDGAAVTGTAFTTEAVTTNAQRFAGGNTIPREYYDFNQSDFLDAWSRFARDDYARKADTYVRTQALAAATSFESTVPSAEPSLAVVRRIIDGVFAIGADPINARASFAVIPDEDYKLLLHTGHSDLLEYLGLALGVEEGSVLNFKLRYDSSLTAGSVVVGASQSIKVRELAGSPIRINAAAIAVGSYDEALFGYVHVMDEFPDALVIVTDAA
jgi:hypothetical protein